MLEINKRTGIPGRIGKGCRSPIVNTAPYNYDHFKSNAFSNQAKTGIIYYALNEGGPLPSITKSGSGLTAVSILL
jgi:hypothetical protein